MKTISRNCCWPAVLMMLGTALVAKADDAVGVVRLSDLNSGAVVRGQSPISDTTSPARLCCSSRLPENPSNCTIHRPALTSTLRPCQSSVVTATPST